MAGDWIPMRMDLHEDPAVIAVAAATGLDEFGVVGRLHRLWSWANKHLTDGNAAGVTSQWVDRYLSTPGFAAAMLDAGWLRARSGGIEFPHFDRWNSQGAKHRALTAQRVRRHRAGGNASGIAPRNAPRVTEALPEKRREEKREEDSPLPPAGPGGGAGDYPAAPATGDEPDPGAAREPRRRPRGPAAPRPDFDPAAEPAEAEPWAELVAAWAAAGLPGHDVSQGIQRTPNRVGWWQARLRDPAWAGRWREAVARAGRSARCRGAGGWKLSVDMFLKGPDMLVRILEGEFDDGPATVPFRPGGRRSIDDILAESRAKRAARADQGTDTEGTGT